MKHVARIWIWLLDALLVCHALVAGAEGWYGGGAGWEGGRYVIRQGRYIGEVPQWLGAGLYYGEFLAAALIVVVMALTITVVALFRTISLKKLCERELISIGIYRVTLIMMAAAILVPLSVYSFRLFFH